MYLRKFYEEARSKINDGQDHSKLDTQTKEWYEVMHKVDNQNNAQVYATESTNMPPQI